MMGEEETSVHWRSGDPPLHEGEVRLWWIQLVLNLVWTDILRCAASVARLLCHPVAHDIAVVLPIVEFAKSSRSTERWEHGLAGKRHSVGFPVIPFALIRVSPDSFPALREQATLASLSLPSAFRIRSSPPPLFLPRHVRSPLRVR
jgi:hypothetical protein